MIQVSILHHGDFCWGAHRALGWTDAILNTLIMVPKEDASSTVSQRELTEALTLLPSRVIHIV